MNQLHKGMNNIYVYSNYLHHFHQNKVFSRMINSSASKFRELLEEMAALGTK